MQVAFTGNNQRVYFQQGQIVFFKQLSQTKKNLGELLHLLSVQTQFERQLTALVRLRANHRIDGCFENLFRCFCCHRFNVNTTFGGCHENNSATSTVQHCTQDRKSTRLNSSHVRISYAVFCLKKKKKRKTAC